MKTILGVDKDLSTLSMLKEEFQAAGFEALITDSGEEALKILKDPAKSVDLVVTNLRHAGPHGLEFIWLIKRTRPGLSVICFSALYEYQNLSPQDRPFDIFVEKSSDLTILKHSVTQLIGKLD